MRLKPIISYFFIFTLGILTGTMGYKFLFDQAKPAQLPEIENPAPELVLNKYAIPALKDYDYQSSQIIIKETIEELDGYTAYLFTYQTTGKQMSGQINIPDNINVDEANKTIIMIRGWYPQHSYKTGSGTKSASRNLAQNGYITIAPDFFCFGSSDPNFEDSWEGRFVKPVNVIELIKSIEDNPTILNTDERILATVDVNNLGIWGHSNGGQIAISVLEATQEPIPTNIWAPVTAPFPYSILFFSRDVEDEGKALRRWLAMFEDDYDVFNFTITKHLDKITAPLQIQHGSADPDALVAWSDTFVENIKKENARRKELKNELSSDQEGTKSVELNQNQELLLEPIDITYLRYAGADHNLRQVYSKALNSDLKFYNKHLD